MAAITETHKADNEVMAHMWLRRNGFELSNGQWMDTKSRWARCEPMQSGKIMIYVGVV